MISLKEFEKRQNILQEKIHHTIALHDEKIIETNFIEERLLLREIVYTCKRYIAATHTSEVSILT